MASLAMRFRSFARSGKTQLQVEKLDQIISVIESLNGSGTSQQSIQPKRIISAASRRKMARAQRARWARIRKESQPAGGKTTFRSREAHHVGFSPQEDRGGTAGRWAKVKAGRRRGLRGQTPLPREQIMLEETPASECDNYKGVTEPTQWRHEISEIAIGWEPVRQKFVKACISTVEVVQREKHRAKVVNSGELGAVVSIKSYQLWDCFDFVSSCRYLGVSQRHSFLDVLLKKSTTPPEALQVLSYFKLFNKTAQEPIRFAKELVQHLTGATSPYEAPFEESFGIMYLVPWFCGLSRIVVANAFGDDDTVREGMRHAIHDEPDDLFVLRDDFNRGVAELKQFGLKYDVLIFEKHLPQTIEFVDRHPDQIFIVDHVAKPRIREQALRPGKVILLSWAIGKMSTAKCRAW